ncbi:MAG: hypothetical protein ACD_49C00069G0001 [uncultured bacterium (gcode 4)]|uniref:Glycine zipper domain-containing protein n=1 Tax=uncultured bacterium (gcode 4) TaxID=1234023 RepID=K2BB61_9BACT|nr:MAG: hypothetical protein ACD_49C00069G0001 [uncultured bacterium (gcode 4)]
MLSTIALATCLMFGVATVTPAMAMANEETGAVVGGVAGITVGAIIGQAIHETTRATLGGAAIGLVPGAIVGYILAKNNYFGLFDSK